MFCILSLRRVEAVNRPPQNKVTTSVGNVKWPTKDTNKGRRPIREGIDMCQTAPKHGSLTENIRDIVDKEDISYIEYFLCLAYSAYLHMIR